MFLRKRTILTLIISLCCSISTMVQAQDFSYVYIQGDKKVPIYVKVEGVMLPRLGKNYALISRLAPGPMRIDILFQQNEYEPVSFNIMVPENGKRAFIISRKDQETRLFDVEQNFYLNANNDIHDDHLPTILNNRNASSPIVNNIEKEETPKTIFKTPEDKKKEEKQDKEEQSKPDHKNASGQQEEGLQFIDNITFNNSNNTTDESKSAPDKDNNTTANGDIINSDCNKPIDFLPFIRLKNSLNSRKTEDERLGLILESAKSNCFNCEQAKEMVNQLESDLAKFSALKGLYPKITDQSNYAALSELLSDEEWKAYFSRLLKGE